MDRVSHSFSFKFLVVCSYVCRLFQLIANLGARIPVNDTVGVVACVNCYFWRLLRQVLAGWLGERRMNYSLPGG